MMWVASSTACSEAGARQQCCSRLRCGGRGAGCALGPLHPAVPCASPLGRTWRCCSVGKVRGSTSCTGSGGAASSCCCGPAGEGAPRGAAPGSAIGATASCTGVCMGSWWGTGRRGSVRRHAASRILHGVPCASACAEAVGRARPRRRQAAAAAAAAARHPRQAQVPASLRGSRLSPRPRGFPWSPRSPSWVEGGGCSQEVAPEGGHTPVGTLDGCCRRRTRH